MNTRGVTLCDTGTGVALGNMKIDTQDQFVGCLAEILRVGLSVCDAMKLSPHERRRTSRISFDGQEWVVDAAEHPQRMITMTLLE